MPFADKETRAEYYRRYRLERAEVIKARQADWFQENKERLTLKQRRTRHAKAAAEAIAALQSIQITHE